MSSFVARNKREQKYDIKIYNCMRIVNLADSCSIMSQYMAELRDKDVQKDRMRFRQNVIRVGRLMAYEASKLLTYAEREIETPVATARVQVLDDPIVLGTVFRAGLPFHQGFLEVFDNADNAFVSAYRYYKDRECAEVGVKIEYIASPSLEGKTLVIVDPMLATGESMELGYQALLTKGKPRRLLLACVIACQQGVEHLQRLFPDDDVVLFCATIDPVLNGHKYIVPGLGDAGDLMYGEKI